ncbi:hypothetical protein BO221_36720 [Archangium sp. Cb G35]|nr:hypothetical protein BO221_36720 [Archangium sp. Cb G35]
MDEDDLWLLEAVVELATPLHMLLGPKVALALNMPRGHGLSPEALCEKLASLSERELIRVHQAGDEAVVARTRAELERALSQGERFSPDRFVYRLTPRGGEAWEHYAQPDWSRYIDAGWDREPEICVIEAASREAAEEEYQRHERSGNEYRPLPESKHGEVLRPWWATYWKVLPAGYRLRYAWVSRQLDVHRIMSSPPPAPWYSSLAHDR